MIRSTNKRQKYPKRFESNYSQIVECKILNFADTGPTFWLGDLCLAISDKCNESNSCGAYCNRFDHADLFGEWPFEVNENYENIKFHVEDYEIFKIISL